MTAESTAPELPRRGRGRPLTPGEARRAQRLAARQAALDEDKRVLARELDDVAETQLARLLGMDRATLRRLKTL